MNKIKQPRLYSGGVEYSGSELFSSNPELSGCPELWDKIPRSEGRPQHRGISQKQIPSLTPHLTSLRAYELSEYPAERSKFRNFVETPRAL